MTKTLQDRIRDRLDDLGTTARAASLKGGASADLLRKILDNPDAAPRSTSMAKIARALETTEEWLLHERGPKSVSSIDDTASDLAAPVMPGPPLAVAKRSSGEVRPVAGFDLTRLQSSMNPNLPVLGTAAGSLAVLKKGGFELETRVIEYVRRPPALETVADAYAIYVAGSSMEPKHPDGELCFVHPHKPPRIGDTVVVQLKYSDAEAAEAYIARLDRRTAEHVIVGKLNPVAALSFDKRFVAALHRVLTMNELFQV